MKNFQELFNETKKLSDRRLAAFSELKKEFKETVLPEFAKTIEACDYRTAFFKADNKIFQEEMTEYINSEYSIDNIEYVFAITKEGKLRDASFEYDGYNSKYELLDGEFEEIRNIGILELIRLIKARIIKYNEKLFKDSAKAEDYLK